jgi:tetratricopeptide (TPR) repeat protein
VSAHYDKAVQLFRVSRYGEAEKELRAALVQDPQDAHSQALLGMCLSLQGRMEEAVRTAQGAIKAAPNDPHCHFLLAQVLYNAKNWKESLKAVEEALRLEPGDPDHYHLLSMVHYAQSDWEKALAAAKKGLEFDSEHVDCHDAQAKALMKLGRASEAHDSVATAMRLEPDRAESHATQGWAYLEQGKTAEAMASFREALRIEPNDEWARQGILEAMKARNPLYGLMLKYFLFMGKLSGKMQWQVILGGYLAYQVVKAVGKSNPALQPYTWPLMGLYLLFVFFSWTASPLFNLILRLDKFGRMALNEDEIACSNWVGLLFLVGLPCLGAYFLVKEDTLLLGAIFCLLMIIPVVGVFHFPAGKSRNKMKAYAYLMAGLGAAGLVVPGQVSFILWIVFLVGVLLSSFLISFLSTRD